MKKIRLDDMTLDNVRDLYNEMFDDLIDDDTKRKIYNIYLEKYNKMEQAEKDGYAPPSAMGRKYNYLKNMLYGWYIEDLFFVLIKKNPKVLSVEMTGNDSKHSFIYNNIEKKISVEGNKTTIPDYLITMKNGDKIYLELKTAAAEVYSIKNGNVKQLQKTMGTTNIYSMIIMIDLVNKLYEIKDLKFFINSSPFVNQRMEGQLCYDFPNPTKKFSEIIKEDFSSYIDKKIFLLEDVVKYRCLHIALEKENKEMIKDIKIKISLDELKNEFEFQKKEFDKKLSALIEKTHDHDIEFKSWDEILDKLNDNEFK